jgi:hypothetical protein
VIEHVSPRTNRLEVHHVTAGYATQEVTIAEGETTQSVTLTLGATVRGTVRWDDGKPAADVHVFAGDVVVRTSADGRYEITNARTPWVTVRATRALALGERSFEQRYALAGGRDVRQLELAPGET